MTGVNCILEYANSHVTVTANDLASAYDMKPATARQHLSRLAATGNIIRVGYGKYAKASVKEEFSFEIPDNVKSLYNKLHSQFPFADFCVYSGDIYTPLQHHLSVNKAIYVETNRDTVDSVFSVLRESHYNVYKQPDTAFMIDYVDLKKDCIIVKPLVTEAPVQTIETIPCPTLEKLLIDILKDSDLGYLRGAEFNYMMETALSQYMLSISKLLRYAGRRNVRQQIQKILDKITIEKP